MKLQPREQSIIGIGAIGVVLFVGWLSFIEPSWKKFSDIAAQAGQANATVQSNEGTIANLTTQRDTLKTQVVEKPLDKEVVEVNYQKGETLDSIKIDLLSETLEVAQKEDGNILIYAKPLPPPPPPPQPVPTTPPPGTNPNAAPAAPEIKVSDYIEEVPYEIALRGNYTTINKFVDDIAGYDKVVEIARLEIIPETKAGGSLKDPTKPLKAVFTLNYIVRKG